MRYINVSSESKSNITAPIALDLKSFTLDQLKEVVRELGWERYRASQIFSWLWQKGINDISQMTNLAKAKRESLKAKYYISQLKLIKSQKANDGTEKFLFALTDNQSIESVYIPELHRKTVCVSTQVGCALGCKICYTGQIGFKRDLKFFEIVDQVLQVQKITGQRLTNVVFMGMGEPLLNLTECEKATEILNSDFGLNIGARRITISTIGITDKIYQFVEFPLQVKLAISLNGTDDKTRNYLMPFTKYYPLKELIKAAKFYTKIKRKRITFEYVLVKRVNDRKEDIARLPRLLKGIPCKINLIPFNPFPGCELKAPTLAEVENFARSLYSKLPAVTIRKSRGSEILAGCGQLSGKYN
ncbi:MAG: 23S rRNA (adenine(2503)-C(2))-methyltransferase RlmN [candidate division WOR-3 bacterium]